MYDMTVDSKLARAETIGDEIRNRPTHAEMVTASRRELKQLFSALKAGVRDEPRNMLARH